MAEVSVKLWRPDQLGVAEWQDLQEISRAALAATLDMDVVSEEDIAHLVSLDYPHNFRASHVYPKLAVGTRFNANQMYLHGRVAVAEDDGRVVGFGTSYWNTSYGPPEGPHDDSAKAHLIRLGKMATMHNYLTIRDLSVAPEERYIRHGIGTQVARELLLHAIPWQPVTAYYWPDLDPEWMQPTLERHTFVPTGGQFSHIFGPNKDPVWQVRMQAPHAWGVRRSLRKRNQDS